MILAAATLGLTAGCDGEIGDPPGQTSTDTIGDTSTADLPSPDTSVTGDTHTTDDTSMPPDTTQPQAVCGDGVVGGTEACDGGDHNGQTCVSRGFVDGTLGCTSACTFDEAGCNGPGPVCGDGDARGDEACDGSDLGGQSCATLGFSPGPGLRCADDCTLDFSACTTCGDATVEGDEDCDGSVDPSLTCQTLGFDTGTVTCGSDCRHDTSACALETCGNATLDPGEDCEGSDLDGASCQSEGFSAGSLSCRNNCTFDTSACTRCGDGVVEGAEVCDGASLDGQTCQAQGFDGGTLSCASDCAGFDTSDCTACGNGTVEAAEQCEAGKLGGATCASVGGFSGGTLACNTNSCTFDTSGCNRCGDGTLDTGEQCDGSALGGASCSSVTPTTPLGQLGCTAGCQYDTTGCSSATDSDGDGVNDGPDPDPNDPYVCGDSDSDSCDDCSLAGTQSPANDGYDPDGNGQCELELDRACMNGANAASDPYRELACATFAHMNNDRAHFSAESGNAAPLIWNEDIWEIAYAHSMDMCVRGFFGHTNPDGDGPSQRATAASLGFLVAENIAVNLDPGAAEYAWMNEPTCTGHRGSILKPGHSQAAVGYVDCADITSPSGYQWANHHIVTTNFRYGSATSAFCNDAATSCEVPPDPPTTATCPAQLISWGFCPAPDASMLSQWGCPND